MYVSTIIIVKVTTMHKIKIVIKALLLRLIDRILVNDLYMAYYGREMYFVLWELDQYLRSEIKYKNREELQDVRDKLYELMEDNGVDFNRVE